MDDEAPHYPLIKERTHSDAALQEVLGCYWNTINEALHRLSEDDVARLIELEREGLARKYILLRLHQRHNRLRSDRERRKLSTGRGREEG